MKPCVDCGCGKTAINAYAHPSTADRLDQKCKTCRKSYQKNRRDAALEEHQARDRARYLAQPQRRAAIEAYQQTPKGKEIAKVAKAKWSRKHRNERNAQQRAYRAVQRAQIAKPTACQGCHTEGVKLEMHHEDYSKPLEVEWLCAKCHGLTRRKRA